MHVLIVKTSSMGDLIHTLPAVSDAVLHVPDIQFEWVAEEAFAEIPSWHPAVERVIPIAIRRWRKNWRQAWASRNIQTATAQLRNQKYDCVIDAQGLVKSAIITRLAWGHRYGMDRWSCREPLASMIYSTRISIPRGSHAIDRVRDLFAQVFNYRYTEEINYGLSRKDFEFSGDRPYVVFLHGSSWPSKLWPQTQWIELAALANKAGFLVYLPWGNEDEKMRAQEIALRCNSIRVPAKMPLRQIAGLLAHASGIVGVDTGLSHLAAALEVPAVTLYIATDPGLTGTRGRRQTCMLSGTIGGSERQTINNEMFGLNVLETESLTAENVWGQLNSYMKYAE